jgi:hypothetical protein
MNRTDRLHTPNSAEKKQRRGGDTHAGNNTENEKSKKRWDRDGNSIFIRWTETRIETLLFSSKLNGYC